MTSNSLYPILVQSQASSRAAKTFGLRAAAAPKFGSGGGVGGGVRLTDFEPLSPEVSPHENLFEFTFEKRPLSSNAHYSLQVICCRNIVHRFSCFSKCAMYVSSNLKVTMLHSTLLFTHYQMRSRGIDIIYNPHVIQFMLTRFLFASPSNQSGADCQSASSTQYGMAEGLTKLTWLRRYQMIKKQTKVRFGYSSLI